MLMHSQRESTMLATALTCSALLCCAAEAGAPPANPDYKIWVPSNTGIPGYVDMDMVEFGPDGRLWTAARDFFWQQGGVAALDFATGQWRTYSSVETPLGQESNAIDFAADGSAWIAGQHFIARLHADGDTFTAYTPASTGVLVSGMYENISVAPNGHIWASNPGQVDLGGGLFEFDGVSWSKHEEPWMTTWTGFGFAPALSVIARSNGDVWATFISSPPRVGRYRDGQWTVYESSQGPYIIDYAEDSDGTLCGVSASATFRLNDVSGQWQQIGPFGASEIALDLTSDSLYIQSNLTTVMRYNGSTWSTFATFPGWVGGMGVAPNGDVWIAAEAWPTHYDLHHYNSSGQMQRVYNRSNTGMHTYFGPGMYLDRDGIMWFNDFEYGTTRREPTAHGFNWRNFGQYNGQEEVFPFWVFPVGLPWWQTPGASFWTESVDQIFHDSQGNFWLRGPNIISRSNGDDLSQWTSWTPGHAGFPAACDSVGEAADGTIWVGDSFQAYRLDGSSWTEVPIGIQGQFAPVHGWTVAPDGSLWVARVGTFYRYVKGAFVPIFEIPGLNIQQFQFAPNGDLWVATVEGLYRYHGPNHATFTLYTPQNSAMVEPTVVGFDIRPSDGVVAVATTQQEIPPYTGGVAVFDVANDQWTAYNHGSSFLPFYAPGDVQFDADGHLWVGVLNFGAVQIFIGAQPAPLGDINGDGRVNIDDLLAVIAAWGDCPKQPPCPADVTGDGQINIDDLLVVIGNWV